MEIVQRVRKLQRRGQRQTHTKVDSTPKKKVSRSPTSCLRSCKNSLSVRNLRHGYHKSKKLNAGVFKRETSFDISVCIKTTSFPRRLSVLSLLVARAHVYLTRPTSIITILTQTVRFYSTDLQRKRKTLRLTLKLLTLTQDTVVLRSFKEWEVLWGMFLLISRKDSIFKNSPKEEDLPPAITW